MIRSMKYLTDDELVQLMTEVETEDLVAAPPDLMENVCSCLESNSKKEYRRYCFRVWTSVAAAVALVFLIPRWINVLDTYQSKDNRINQISVFEDVLGGNRMFDQVSSFKLFEEENGG